MDQVIGVSSAKETSEGYSRRSRKPEGTFGALSRLQYIGETREPPRHQANPFKRPPTGRTFGNPTPTTIHQKLRSAVLSGAEFPPSNFT